MIKKFDGVSVFYFKRNSGNRVKWVCTNKILGSGYNLIMVVIQLELSKKD